MIDKMIAAGVVVGLTVTGVGDPLVDGSSMRQVFQRKLEAHQNCTTGGEDAPLRRAIATSSRRASHEVMDQA